MSIEPHECEPEDVCAGLMVTLYLDLIAPLCPQHDERTLRRLLERHAEPIASMMVSAGIQAAVQLFKNEGGMSRANPNFPIRLSRPSASLASTSAFGPTI